MFGVRRRSIGALLLERGTIDKVALEEALALQRIQGGFLGQILIDQGRIDERDLIACLTRQGRPRYGRIAAALAAIAIVPVAVFRCVGTASSRPYAAIEVAVLDLEDRYEARGRTVADREQLIASTFAAPVLSIAAEEGEAVEPGAPLVLLDRAELDDLRAQSQAHLDAARARLATFEGPSIRAAEASIEAAGARVAILERGARAEDVDAASTDLARARIALEAADRRLARGRDLLTRSHAAATDVEALETQVQLLGEELRRAELRVKTLEGGAPEEERRAAGAELSAASAGLDRLRSDAGAARAAVEEAEAGLRTIDRKIARATILAPFGGVVARRYIRPGEVAGAGAAILRLVDVSAVHGEIDVEERRIETIAKGDAATVVFDAYPNVVFDATVESVSATSAEGPRLNVLRSDEGARRFPVRVRFALGPDARPLREGLSFRATFTYRRPGAVCVPPQALVRAADGKLFAWADENGTAEKRRERPGLEQRERIEILSGLAPGDRVAIGALAQLREGAPVEPLEKKPGE